MKYQHVPARDEVFERVVLSVVPAISEKTY